jgi:hypothetical protein
MSRLTACVIVPEGVLPEGVCPGVICRGSGAYHLPVLPAKTRAAPVLTHGVSMPGLSR